MSSYVSFPVFPAIMVRFYSHWRCRVALFSNLLSELSSGSNFNFKIACCTISDDHTNKPFTMDVKSVPTRPLEISISTGGDGSIQKKISNKNTTKFV